MQEELKDLKIEELAEGTGRQAMKGDTPRSRLESNFVPSSSQPV